MSFVGFVSGKQKIVDPSIDNEMPRIDALLTQRTGKCVWASVLLFVRTPYRQVV